MDTIRQKNTIYELIRPFSEYKTERLLGFIWKDYQALLKRKDKTSEEKRYMLKLRAEYLTLRN